MHTPKSGVGNISAAQRNMLLEFMSSHKQLVSGKFSATFTFKDGQKLWQQVTTDLNAIPGARKDWKQWRKTWQDLRTKLKSKNSRIRLHSQGTGGGSPTTETLTATDETILSLICPTQLDGDMDISEGHAEFIYNFEDLESANIEVLHEASTSNKNLETVSPPTEKPQDAKETIKDNLPATKLMGKRKAPARRLTNSIDATNNLAQELKKRNNMRENYYKEKLNLLQRKVSCFEKMADALEKLSNK